MKTIAILIFLLNTSASAVENTSDDGLSELVNNAKSSEKENEIRALKTELLVNATEEKAMGQIRKLIQMHKGSTMEADLQMRQAELYMRMSKTSRFFEMNRDSATIVRFTPQLAKKNNEKANIQKAIDTYDYIQRHFPNFRDMDLVLFNNAFARQQVQQDAQSKKLYLQLVKNYPNSFLIPETYLALGEMLFDKHNFKEAKEYFLQIIKYPESRIYPYGRYKLGWAYFNLHENDAALAELEEVVRYSKMQEKTAYNKRLDLRKEALGDMVLFFSDFRPPDQALSYFKKQAGEDEAGFYLVKLAKIYVNYGKDLQQIVVLNDLIKSMGTSPYLPRAYNDIIETYERKKDYKLSVAKLDDFHKLCTENGTWSKKWANNAKAVEEFEDFVDCQKTFDAIDIRMAQKWDKQVRKKQDPVLADASEHAYELYLTRAKGKVQEVPMNYAFSELLFFNHKYRQASDQYFITAQLSTDKKITHDATYASIVSLEKSVKDKWNKDQEERYVTLASFYIQKNPKGEHLEAVEFKRAFIIYDNGRFDEAAPLLKSLGEKYASKPQGEKAQDLYLDILNFKKSYTDIKNYSAQILKSASSADRKNKLTKLYQQAYFSEIQTVEQKDQVEQAAAEYQTFALANKNSDLAEKAWWNSLALYQKVGLKRKLADSALKFAEVFPQSDRKKEAVILAEQNYEVLADFQKAIPMLEQLVIMDAKNKAQWLEAEGDLLFLEGQYARAKKIYARIMDEKMADAKLMVKLLGKMAEMEKVSGNKAGYYSYTQRIAKSGLQPEASLAAAELAEKTFEEKNIKEAFQMASQVVGMDTTAASEAKARARYIQAQILEAEFVQQSVKASPERIAMVLSIKTEKLDKAQRAYQAAVSYNDASVSVHSVAAMARLYGEFAKSVRSVRLPAEIPEKDAAAFYKEMDNLAAPMEEKEVETIEQAVKLAEKLNLHDGTIGDLRQRLNELNRRSAERKTIPVYLPEIVLPKAGVEAAS